MWEGGRPRVLRGEVSLRRSLLVRATMEVGGGSESLLVSTMLPPPSRLHALPRGITSFTRLQPLSHPPPPRHSHSLTRPSGPWKIPLSGRWIAT